MKRFTSEQKHWADALNKLVGNFFEYPKAIYSKGKKCSFTDGNYITYTNEKGEERWRIGSEHGYLRAFDEMILRGIFSFLTEVNNEYVCIFSDYQLLKRLSLDANTAINYRRLRKSKNKISALDMTLTEFLTEKGRRTTLECYPLFKKCYLSKMRKRRKKSPLHLNFLVLNDLFAFSIAGKYFFYYDLQEYRAIGKPTAQRIWEYLEKKRIRIKKFTYTENFEVFCRKIPIETERLYQARALIKKNLSLLREKGLIKGFNFDGHGNVVIHFDKRKRRYVERKQFIGAEERLFLDIVEYGVSDDVAKELISKYDDKDIRFQLDVLPYRSAKHKEKALTESVKGNLPAPKNYAEKKEKYLAEKKKRGELIAAAKSSIETERIQKIIDELKDKIAVVGATGSSFLDTATGVEITDRGIESRIHILKNAHNLPLKRAVATIVKIFLVDKKRVKKIARKVYKEKSS
jgi:hypothetical protein